VPRKIPKTESASAKPSRKPEWHWAARLKASGFHLMLGISSRTENRVAFAWKVASLGLPTVLMYLGLTGDKGISSDPMRDNDHWRETVLNNTREIFPPSLWERPIQCNGTPLWLLILLCHKFHLWLLRMRRTQCGHR
jgi:hypothetical protein